MKTIAIACGFFCCWYLAAGSQVFAQNGTCVVDINQLFDRHPTFKADLEKLAQEAEALKANVAQQRRQLQAKAEQLALVYQANTPEYVEQEKTLAMENAKIDLDAREKMRELMRREARLHYDVYGEITEAIGRFARETGTSLVIRHNPVKVSEKDPESIMRQVNTEVIWFRQDRDITPQVLQRLGQGSQAAATRAHLSLSL